MRGTSFWQRRESENRQREAGSDQRKTPSEAGRRQEKLFGNLVGMGLRTVGRTQSSAQKETGKVPGLEDGGAGLESTPSPALYVTLTWGLSPPPSKETL